MDRLESLAESLIISLGLSDFDNIFVLFFKPRFVIDSFLSDASILDAIILWGETEWATPILDGILYGVIVSGS